MSDYPALLTTARSQMNSKNFEQAETTLSTVIENLKPSNDEERKVLYDSLIDRSKCYLELNRFIPATKDCEQVIQDFKSISQDSSATDSLKHFVAKAYRGLGQIAETLTDVQKAIFNYYEASKYDPSLGTNESIFSLLKAIGVPDASEIKDEFDFLKKCVDNVLLGDSLSEPLEKTLKYLKETEVNEDMAKRLAASHLGRVIVAIIAIHYDTLPVSKIALEAALEIAKIGVSDLWTFIDLFYYPLEFYRVHDEHLTLILNTLKYANTQTHAKLAISGFVHIVAQLLDSSISSENRDSAFFLLFQFAMSNQLCTEVAEENVLPHIIKDGTFSAMMLFSRLSIIPQFCEEAVSEGILEIAFNLLESGTDNEDYIVGILIVFARSLLYFPPRRDNKKDAEKVFDHVVPVLKKHYKSAEICSNAFAALTLATKYAPNKVKEQDLLKLSTSILGIMMKQANVAQNIIAFFFECLEADMVTELKSRPALLQVSMLALQNYPENEILVERCIALAIVLEHPHRVSLAMTAANRHRDSAVLRKYIPRIVQ